MGASRGIRACCPRRFPSSPRKVTRLLRSLAHRLALLAVVALFVPAVALAQSGEPVQLDGDPLNLWTNSEGSIQVGVEGYVAGEWYSPGPITDPITGNQGPNPTP